MKGQHRVAGRVIQAFTPFNHFAEFYVIEPVDDHWFTLEVRDALLMSETSDGVFPFTQTGHSK